MNRRTFLTKFAAALGLAPLVPKAGQWVVNPEWEAATLDVEMFMMEEEDAHRVGAQMYAAMRQPSAYARVLGVHIDGLPSDQSIKVVCQERAMITRPIIEKLDDEEDGPDMPPELEDREPPTDA